MVQSIVTVVLFVVLSTLSSAEEITVSGKLIFKGGQSIISSLLVNYMW